MIRWLLPTFEVVADGDVDDSTVELVDELARVWLDERRRYLLGLEAQRPPSLVVDLRARSAAVAVPPADASRPEAAAAAGIGDAADLPAAA